MRLWLSPFLLCFIAAPAFAQTDTISDGTKAKLAPYRQCLLAKARALEASDAQVQDVIAASLTACRSFRDKLEAGVAVDLAISAVEEHRDASPRVLRMIMDKIDQRLSGELQLAILEKRAARKRR